MDRLQRTSRAVLLVASLAACSTAASSRPEGSSSSGTSAGGQASPTGGRPAPRSATSGGGIDFEPATGVGGSAAPGSGGAGGAAVSAGSGGATTTGSAGGASTASSSGGAATVATTGAGGATTSGSGGDATVGVATSASSSGGGGTSGTTGGGDGSSTSGGGGAGGGGGSGSGGAPPACTSDDECDDGVFCNGLERCDALMGCLPGEPPACDDGVGCTSDVCDSQTDLCAHVPNDAACSDGVFCNGLETCDATLGCFDATPVDCDDGIPCSIDSCDETTNGCVHTPNDASCDDFAFCNGQEFCEPGVGCLPGWAVLCNDGLTCTSDSCDDNVGACVFVPNDSACQDGVHCNGKESCSPKTGDPLTGCAAGQPVVCEDDGIACSLDACSEGVQGCEHTPDHGLCAAGESCVLAGGGCIKGAACTKDADCLDPDLCNGAESCDPLLKVCRAGKPKSCSDGLACTTESCDPMTGQCIVTPHDTSCDDGFACNGLESCDAKLGCVSGSPIDCNDAIGCTFDACEEPTGSCVHLELHALCTDGAFCTGTERCDATLGCVAGTPPVCSDGVACTVDYCDTKTDACAAKPNDGLCACGESCDAKTGCGHYCVPASCQGKTYACGNCLDDDGDCRVDASDAMCVGPCDNEESSFSLGIPGGNNAPCKQDCFFDADTGAGNDDCYWSHSCDPFEVAPAFHPEGSKCAYAPQTKIAGTSLSCTQAQSAQSQVCTDTCAPLTPNGCDCFGCCLVPGGSGAVWLGSTDDKGNATCTVEALGDPSRCQPCTQVPSCLNTCDTCELCLGKDVLPPECGCQECPAGAQLCGAPCGGSCPFGFFCISGCCAPAP